MEFFDIAQGTTVVGKLHHERVDPRKEFESFVLWQRNSTTVEIPEKADKGEKRGKCLHAFVRMPRNVQGCDDLKSVGSIICVSKRTSRMLAIKGRCPKDSHIILVLEDR